MPDFHQTRVSDGTHDQGSFLLLGKGDDAVAAGVNDLCDVGREVLFVRGELLLADDLDAVAFQNFLDDRGHAGAKRVGRVDDGDLGHAKLCTIVADGDAGAGVALTSGEEVVGLGSFQTNGAAAADGGDALVGNELLHRQNDGRILVQADRSQIIFRGDLLEGVGRGCFSALVVFVDQLDRATHDAAVCIDILHRKVSAFLGVFAIPGTVAGEGVENADVDGVVIV